jgi:lipoyl(octanoyl) transferase
MSLEMMIAEYIDLELTNYFRTFGLQKELAKKRVKEEIPDTILISEHNPVINFGTREVHNSFSEDFLRKLRETEGKADEETAVAYLKEKGIDFCRSSRGGGATFIGRGQINFYPIVAYEKITGILMGMNEYKEKIDQIMHSVLRSYGLNVRIHSDLRKEDENSEDSVRKDIWIRINEKDYKLGGKGIHFSRGVAYSGFNFYLKRGSEEGFKYVNPCGYSSEELGVISIEAALGRTIPIQEFKKRVLEEIKNKFKYPTIKRLESL